MGRQLRRRAVVLPDDSDDDDIISATSRSTPAHMTNLTAISLAKAQTPPTPDTPTISTSSLLATPTATSVVSLPAVKSQTMSTVEVEVQDSTIIEFLQEPGEQTQLNTVESATSQQATPEFAQERQASTPEKICLAQDILDAIKTSNRKSLTKGDVAIVLDPEHLDMTLRLDSTKLFATCTALRAEGGTLSASEGTPDGLRHGYVLVCNGSLAAAMPKLQAVDIMASLTDAQCGSHAIAARNATKVKHEEGATATFTPSRGWTRSYEAFFSLVQKGSRQFNRSATAARVEVQNMIEIARTLGAEGALKNVHLRLDNRDLLTAITAKALTWLKISLALQDKNIYKEAFTHVAGRYLESAWSNERADIPEVVLKAVERHSAKVHMLRETIDKELLLLFPTTGTHFVTQSHDQSEYHIGNIFTMFMREHLTLLAQDGLGIPQAQDGAIVQDDCATCDHNSNCRSIAGFYRMIGKGGDAYLHADELLSENGLCSRRASKLHEATVRKCLAELKIAASRIVARLAESKALFTGKYELPYLTCVEPADEDIPFGDDEETEDDVEMDG